jgi:ABC-type Mn2+/Zn2+ transport system permease subunit/metal-dependent hydrolase (beta-lactamase superfamily II)
MAELFTHEFFRNALLAAIFASISCGMIGTYVVSRRIVFISGGITHASFGGIGIGYFLGVNPILGAAAFAVISALGIEYLTKKIEIRNDSVIAMFWAFGMATGIIFIYITPGYAPSLMSYLFGNILTVSAADIFFMGILTAVIVLFFMIFIKIILFISFDEEFTLTRNIPCRLFNYILIALVALTVVINIKVVGIILALALLTIPQNIANSLTTNYKKIILLSVLTGFIGLVAGLLGAYYFNIPSGASIVFTLVIMLAIVKAIKRLFILAIFGAVILISATIYQNHEYNKKITDMENTNIKITVIYDNNTFKKGLETAWGFSCIVTGTEKTILFDTGGDGSILLSNMRELGIKPENIDLIVLSHIHNDHVGGLQSFLEVNHKVTIYLPATFPESFKDDIREYGAKIIEIQGPREIVKGVSTTGTLGTTITEQSMVIRTEKGLVVITGCAHPGIAKIIDKAKDIFNQEVLLAIGGFHLSRERGRDIENLVSEIKKLGVKYIGPCHCSGDVARQLFRKEYAENYIDVGVGKVIGLKDL